LDDILIVGGGPVGSHAACRLAAMGYSTVVIDQKADQREPVCCTGIISEECFRAFQIDPKVVLRHVGSASVYSPSGIRMRLERAAPQAVVIDRPAFNALLAERARGQGARYIQGARAVAIDVHRDRASVTVTSGGTRSQLEARAVVVATGFSTLLTEPLGLGRPRDLAGGAQAEVETCGVEEVEVYFGQRAAPGFFAWLVPTTGNRALAGLLSRHAPQGHLRTFLTFLKESGRIESADVPVISGAVPLRASGRTYASRVLVVGTAAGLVKPVTGGGIYFGLLAADMAADVMHQAFDRNDLSGRELAAYQRRWKRRLGSELRVGSWARRFFERQSDERLDRLFYIMNSQHRVERLLGMDDISFDWHSKAVWHLLSEGTLAKLIIGMKKTGPRH
jgi:digeranylgeranylglycerophospholipid reductase